LNLLHKCGFRLIFKRIQSPDLSSDKQFSIN
jgi:hypothetical protein